MQKSICSIFTLLLLWTCASTLSAQEITLDAAKEKAAQFFNNLKRANATKRAPRKAPQLVLANDRNEFYVFNDEANGGYVVISGDERMPDVLGYSEMGRFDAENIPCNMRAWLEDYAKQVDYLRTHPEVPASRRTVPERDEISPLLNCRFGQGNYYNEKCPIVGGKHCVTGCVATAMAQIMYYYQWPKQTTDVIPAYTTFTNKINMPAIPVTTIDWDNMLDNYGVWGVYSNEQIDAISTLMLLCGTSVGMDYGLDGSSASTSSAAAAFLRYFDYDDILEEISRYEWELEDWEQMLYDDLNDGHPVFYSGFYEESDQSGQSGHAFILDGYKDGYFHVNWGWGGYVDDYFLLTDLGGYNYDQFAIVGIQPAYPDIPRRYAVLENDKMTLYYDTEKSHRTGTILPMDQWSNYKEQITECVIDPSFANLKSKSLSSLFSRFSQLKSIKGLENLNTSKVTNMRYMFYGCSGLTSLDVSNFKTDNVTDMYGMFWGCSNLTSLDVSGFKTDNVASMSCMFHGCSSLTSLDVSGFKTDNVTNMRYMFHGCSSLTSLDVSGFKTDNVTNMSCMFSGCSNLTSLDVSGFKTDNVTNMSYMFTGCSGLTSLDVSGFKTGNVTNMSNMFSGCSGLASLDVSGFKNDNATDMGYMFYGCSGLTSLDVSGFKTDNVTDMSGMFSSCSSLTSLDVSGFKTDNVTNMGSMFHSCSLLKTIYASEKWNMSNVVASSYMFTGCNKLTGGAGTTYQSTHFDGDYARIDGGLENPGYFTYKENTNAIHTVEDHKDNGSIYGLSGVRLRSSEKNTDGLKSGIYLVNGKKLMVK